MSKTQKMTITIDDDMKKKMDAYSAKWFFPKSSIIRFALVQFFNNQKDVVTKKDLKKIESELKKINAALSALSSDQSK